MCARQLQQVLQILSRSPLKASLPLTSQSLVLWNAWGSERPSHFWIFHNVRLPRTRSSCPSFCRTSTSWTGRTTGSLSLMRRGQLCVLESHEGLGPKVCDLFQVAFYRLSGHVNGFFSGVTLGYNVRKFYYTNCKPTLWLRSEYDFKFFGACPWRSKELKTGT